jgi:hypothetical protein
MLNILSSQVVVAVVVLTLVVAVVQVVTGLVHHFSPL